MKTVRDYLDLGLVFVDDDKLRSSTNNKDDKEVCMSGLCIAHKRYCDGFRGGNAIFFYPCEWTPLSFAWRNNDGVKPEYSGLIQIECESGRTHKGISRDFMYWWDDGTIVKWRPVVLQSDDTQDKLSGGIFTAMVSVGFTSKKFCDALIEVYKPKFTIKKETPKTTMTVNIEGRDYLIPSRTPTVSPKEDKPMKPVYTADMHAKNELPPVDSKVKVCIEEAGFYVDEQDVKFEGKAVTVKAAFSNTESEKIVAVENEDGNCYCYIIECIKPIIKTIKVNGFDVTAPMSEAPEHRKMVYLAHAAHVDFNLDFTWQGDDASVSWLSRGLIHSTKSAAIAHAKAMLGIDPNA